MATPATARFMLIILLMTYGASEVLSTVYALAPGETGHTVGGEDTHHYRPDGMSDEDQRELWLTREKERSPEPPLLAISAASACVVLVALLAAALIYRERKPPT
jgi:hypothetical protein